MLNDIAKLIALATALVLIVLAATLTLSPDRSQGRNPATEEHQ